MKKRKGVQQTQPRARVSGNEEEEGVGGGEGNGISVLEKPSEEYAPTHHPANHVRLCS